MDKREMTPPTPHNAAAYGDFAKTVLMPGDPKRSHWIAHSFLTETHLVNDVRGVQGYTGMYKGSPVSVMASTMGMPSMTIYAHELFLSYGVRHIIRIGTAGAIDESVRVGDVIASQSTFTNSAIPRSYGLRYDIAPTASYPLLRLAQDAAKELEIPLTVGVTACSDLFYDEGACQDDILRSFGVLCADMETAAVYLEAMRQRRQALSLLTVTDDPHRGQHLSSEEREKSLTAMVTIALETALGADSDTVNQQD